MEGNVKNLIWHYGEDKNVDPSFRIQFDNLDRRDKRKIKRIMLEDDWSFSGEGCNLEDKTISLIFTKQFSSKTSMIHWAKKFSYDLYFEDRNGKLKKLNNKKRGRPRKNAQKTN